MLQAASQISSPVCVRPDGGLNIAQKLIVIGRIAANMKGWRRPKRERVRSDQEPMKGSNRALKISPAAMARPTRSGRTPSTWL